MQILLLKNRNFWFLLLFFGFLSQVQAQFEIPDSRKSLAFSASFGRYAARDNYYSPLSYSGWIFGGGLGYENQTAEKYGRSEIGFFSGGLRNNAPYAGSMSFSNFSYNEINSFRNGSREGGAKFIGFAIKMNLSNRNNERNTSFDILTTLGLVFNNVLYPDDSDSWQYEMYFHVPLIGWGVRPRYTTPTYEKPGWDFYKPRHLFLFFPKMLALDFESSGTQTLRLGNQLRYAYELQFYRLGYMQKLKAFRHNLRFTALMNL